MRFDIFGKESLSKTYVERYWAYVTSVYYQAKLCVHTYVHMPILSWQPVFYDTRKFPVCLYPIKYADIIIFQCDTKRCEPNKIISSIFDNAEIRCEYDLCCASNDRNNRHSLIAIEWKPF